MLTGAGGNRTIDVEALRRLRKTFTAQVLWLEMPEGSPTVAPCRRWSS